METKPSILTSEFWLMLALQVLLTLNTVNFWNYLPEKYAWVTPLAQAIAGAAYMASRGIAKNGVSADPQVLANKKNFLAIRKRDVKRHAS